MGFLSDLTRGYANSCVQHTGLHYVPSFNDLNSGANDDLEEEELLATSPTMAPPQRPRAAGANGNPRLSRLSNKTEDGPGLDPFPDIHKVGRHTMFDGRKQWLYDNPRGPKPTSVWEEILRSSSSNRSGGSGGGGRPSDSTSA